MLQKLYSWYGKKTVWVVGIVTLLLLVIGVFISFSTESHLKETNSILPTVRVSQVSEIIPGEKINFTGTVRAVSEAHIESEVPGRITSVFVSLGESVVAGQILAQQENAVQRASVLQAEGVYEAALAAAQQSNVSVEEAENVVFSAKNNLISSYRSSYTIAQNALLGTIDNFFGNPDATLPGSRIGGKKDTKILNSERVSFQSIMTDWQVKTTTVSPHTDNVTSFVIEAEITLERLLSMVDLLIELVGEEDSSRTILGVPVGSYNTLLLAERTALNNALSSLQTSQTSLKSAEENLNRVRIGGTNADLSAANAQVKQALGALRVAQANLNKTIFRSPISGTLNSLSVNVGDYVGALVKIAEVANNDALEVSAYVGDFDLERMNVGDEVLIEGKYTGVITNIGSGIDPSTQKTKVLIATQTDELLNGDTVLVRLKNKNSVESDLPIRLPISAFKFSAKDGFVFTVKEGVLVAHEVTLGDISGTYIEVLEGVDKSMEIVTDARGLSAGARVDIVE